MRKKIEKKEAGTRLLMTWIGFSLVLFLLMIWRSSTGMYGKNVEMAWGLFLPALMPNLSMLLGNTIYGATQAEPETSTINRPIFHLSLGFSIFYLLLVLGSLTLYEFSTLSPVEFMQKSTLWLAPIQGLVAATLTVFLTQKGSSPEKTPRS